MLARATSVTSRSPVARMVPSAAVARSIVRAHSDLHHPAEVEKPHFGPTLAMPFPRSVARPDIDLVHDVEILDGKTTLPEEAELWQDDGRAMPEYFVDVSNTPFWIILTGLGSMVVFLSGLGYLATTVDTPYLAKAPVAKRVLPHQAEFAEYRGRAPENRDNSTLAGQNF